MSTPMFDVVIPLHAERDAMSTTQNSVPSLRKPRLQCARMLARAVLLLVTLSACSSGDVVGPDLVPELWALNHIYRMEADGSGVVRLSSSPPRSGGDLPGGETLPAWSPCGTQVAFTSSYGIYVMDSNGSNVRRLTDDSHIDRSHADSEPSWSPDCSKIAFSHAVYNEFQWDISIINADGSGLMELTHGEGGGGRGRMCGDFGCSDYLFAGDTQPAWSPNGSEIAIVRSRLLDPPGSEIHLIDLLGNSVQLTDGLGTRSPSWSPDGLKIAFAGKNVGTIYIVGRDGSGLTEFPTSFLIIGGVAWSPNGETIAFWTFGETHQIYLLDIATSAVTRLTQPGSFNRNLSWSPDGSQAVFQSNRE